MRVSNLRFALTERFGYEKNGAGGKPAENRRSGKSSKTLPMYGLGLPAKAIQRNLKDIYNAA
jgi:hypothetical protein